MSSFPVRRKADRPLPPTDIAKAIRILAPDPLAIRLVSPIVSRLEKPG
jgi:hypothetical protein